MKMSKWIGVVAATAAAAGCGGFNRVSYTRNLPTGEVLMVDANQRAILASRGDRERGPSVCAEPSPDAVTAASLAASGGVEHEAIAAQASLAMSQSSASIGIRTPSIQLLRDGMYRLCEAYQNGAIEPAHYAVMLGQYQQMVVGLVAIEQLTGTVHASQVVLDGGQADADTLRLEFATQRRVLESWDGRLTFLRGRVAEIETNNAVAERDRHRDTANLESYIAERDALAVNIGLLRQTIAQTQLSIGATRAQISEGAPQGPQEAIESQDPREQMYTATTAEVIAKAVRDITFEIIRSGENAHDRTMEVGEASAEPAAAAAPQASAPPTRNWSLLGWIFGARARQ